MRPMFFPTPDSDLLCKKVGLEQSQFEHLIIIIKLLIFTLEFPFFHFAPHLYHFQILYVMLHVQHLSAIILNLAKTQEVPPTKTLLSSSAFVY